MNGNARETDGFLGLLVVVLLLLSLPLLLAAAVPRGEVKGVPPVVHLMLPSLPRRVDPFEILTLHGERVPTNLIGLIIDGELKQCGDINGEPIGV